MSEPKLISPMLDNFDMGDPISDHDGVRCCPAMEKDSDNKYIVKIISTPASPTQLDALLLSGAFDNEDAASDYFKTLSSGIINEAETLQKLSQYEGFIPYTACQLEPMEDSVGYDVYLLSEYRNTLQHLFRYGSLTHLGALNLGIDLCAALAACRRAGYLYVNLKPNNIYLANDQGYRIGDIGFLRLDSLKYASLPERYRSEYTAPEITDAFSSLNTTIDTYAVGLILYQAYNDGLLPCVDEAVPNEDFPAPAYADYEMAEIILKACASDPDSRWQDPAEMGQALIAYMQRNGANDVPIVPVPAPETHDEDNTEEAITETEEESSVVSEADVVEGDATESPTIDEPFTAAEGDLNIEITEDAIYSEDDDGNLTFLDDTTDDETLPNDISEEIDDIEITDEVSDMLEQADELIAHPAPDPVVQPELIDVPIPPPIVTEEINIEEATEEQVPTDNTEPEQQTADEEPEVDTEVVDAVDNTSDEPHKKSSAKIWIRNTFIVIAAIALIVAGFFFYKNYYLQPIESILLEDGGNGSLTVYVTSNVNEKKLTVICSDTYGNQLTSPVIDGKASFEGLAPNAAYKVKVAINGFHRLTGDTSAAYTTPQQTNIVQFTAVTGTEDGSVVLGFTIDGPDSEQWKISYRDDTGENKEIIFSGHILTINALTIGQSYDFTLQPIEDIQIAGINTVTHTAGTIVKAKTVLVTGCVNNTLTAIWAAEDGISVNSWTVRCYGANGFDETIVTTETEASFAVPDENTDYTVEVTAAGMSVSERAYAPANAITVGNFRADDSDPNKLVITWESDEDLPQDGWILLYTANGSAAHEVVCKDGNQAVISPIIPDSEYSLTLQAADGRPVLGGIRVFNSPAAPQFQGYGVSAEHMEFSMCRTPSYSGWNRYDLSDDDYTTTFSVGEQASFLIRMRHEYNTSSDMITILFVFRDENNVVVGSCTVSATWTDMWYRNYCELDIPSIPQTPGEYKVSIYFNGALAGECDFSVVSE